MNIVGNGVDIIQNSRIEKSIRNDKFVKRIFTKSEIKNSIKYKNKASYFAKRFAAKEAASKALGTGFRKGVFWKDLEVVNLPSGKPTINFTGNSLKHLNSLLPSNETACINLTITDEYPYAQAIVIISSELK